MYFANISPILVIVFHFLGSEIHLKIEAHLKIVMMSKHLLFLLLLMLLVSYLKTLLLNLRS